MLTTDFSFSLPEELIAQRPTAERGASRLLVLDGGGGIVHSSVRDIASFVPSGAVMVFNDSKVRRARLYATSAGGGRVELLLLRREGPSRWAAVATRMAKLKAGKRLGLPEGIEAEVREVRPDERVFEFSREIDDDYLERVGHLPLPPYIRRDDVPDDADRYQTVYARERGSAAAPTAGLHFTPGILDGLRAAGVELRFVTLHVGLGTFLPVRAEAVEDHRMHLEEYTVPEETAEAVNAAKREGRPVLAVGTTSVRTLESSWGDGGLRCGSGATSIFIYPGYRFKAVDAMFTNFHTPESTLLMLVSAFAGRERILGAYEEAVKERYRFFSYGDAMLIL
ncbi:MAG: tRNA preQ1(34) S-adenosylmethionine ribosyltransferase-isomerase QueA [Spirochaetes bacterium]|nr:tRNA preQ1(34) S-adenosylmethionine ribosyltransferase-isomerase QueA [Spirochaetota bacterium]MBU1079592.1 tRNA preQ1(34) S-adenosylmethionine ribosyltransferase-isomerase QueA [Spirochaetota bacterium]